MKMWIARDPDGRLKVCNWEMNFNKKTQRWEYPMYPFGTYTLKNDIPEVTFENSPMEVELKLIKKWYYKTTRLMVITSASARKNLRSGETTIKRKRTQEVVER